MKAKRFLGYLNPPHKWGNYKYFKTNPTYILPLVRGRILNFLLCLSVVNFSVLSVPSVVRFFFGSAGTLPREGALAGFVADGLVVDADEVFGHPLGLLDAVRHQYDRVAVLERQD